MPWLALDAATGLPWESARGAPWLSAADAVHGGLALPQRHPEGRIAAAPTDLPLTALREASEDTLPSPAVFQQPGWEQCVLYERHTSTPSSQEAFGPSGRLERVVVRYICLRGLDGQGSGATFAKAYYSPCRCVQFLRIKFSQTIGAFAATPQVFEIFPP